LLFSNEAQTVKYVVGQKVLLVVIWKTYGV